MDLDCGRRKGARIQQDSFNTFDPKGAYPVLREGLVLLAEEIGTVGSAG